MRLIDTETLELIEPREDGVPRYAILSHRWEDEEVTFRDHQAGIDRASPKWSKIVRFCELAKTDGYKYGWVDTCCIDKSSSAELSEAINSMFQWYAQAAKCYVHLNDVSVEPTNRVKTKHQKPETFPESVSSAVAASKWFTRGWTLQELLAPRYSSFYDKHWTMIGSRTALSKAIENATGIKENDRSYLHLASVAKRMSWAANRKTTRPEDRAYSLLGLFGINMPLLYGEGGVKAFLRLQLEILRESDDETIFAWENSDKEVEFYWFGLLAQSPDDFQNSGRVQKGIYLDRKPYYMSNKGLCIESSLISSGRRFNVLHAKAPLNCWIRKDRRMYQLALRLIRDTEFPGRDYRRTGKLVRLDSAIAGEPKQLYIPQQKDQTREFLQDCTKHIISGEYKFPADGLLD